MLWIDKNNIIKEQNDIVIVDNDRCYYNPSEEMLKKHGWQVYEEEENIEDVRQEKLQAIDIYDKSSMVNRFTLNGIEMWLDKSTRVGLELRFRAEKERGLTDTSLWFGSMQFTLPIDVAQSFLYQLEIYASQCYDNTQSHKKNISELTSIEEINDYDFTKSYPNPLEFNI